VSAWPARIAVPISEWPTGKGDFPLTLWVNARAESAGRDALVTESDVGIDRERVQAGKQYGLTLHPAIE
jgi:hypothetical protein